MTVPLPIRVLLVDQQHVTRHGVEAVLRAAGGFEVVGHAASADAALEDIRECLPDVVVAELELDDGDGVELIRSASGDAHGPSFVILTASRSIETYHQAVLAGADGYVRKTASCDEIVAAVRRVAAGLQSLQREEAVAPPTDPVELLLVDLTERERAVLRLLAAGRTNREIAVELFLAEKTIRNYVSSLLAKLGMRNRTEAAAHVSRLAARQEARQNVAS